MKVILLHNADSTYLPPMDASITARKGRNVEIEKIAVDYCLSDPDKKEAIPFCSGCPSNPLTEKWLIAYRKSYPCADFPYFVRQKWKNVKKIDEKFPKKKMLYTFGCIKCSKSFNRILMKFNTIKNVTELICPKCGEIITKDHFKRHFVKFSLVVDTVH